MSFLKLNKLGKGHHGGESEASGTGTTSKGFGNVLGGIGKAIGTGAGRVLDTGITHVLDDVENVIGGVDQVLSIIKRPNKFGLKRGERKLGQDKLLFFVSRPHEPAFTKRNNVALDLPDKFLSKRYKNIGEQLHNRNKAQAEKIITLKDIPDIDLSFTAPIKRKGSFSLFIAKHKEIAGQLTKILMDAPEIESFISTVAFVKDRVNAYLFQYCLAVAIQHRDDTKDIKLPSIAQTFPDQFMDASVFPTAREEIALVSDENRMNVDIPLNFTASDIEVEQRCAYFREDIAVNIHHWYWHSVYPGVGDIEVINKDRRGELFFYMHNQILCRYNSDRICCSLGKVKPLDDLHEAVPEGYFPKIIRSSNNRAYPARTSYATLKDINREGDATVVRLSDLEHYQKVISEAIEKGIVIDNKGNEVPLTEQTGIDVLGNLIECSDLSINKQKYGDLHNLGHVIIAFSHDPDSRHLEEYGVMGDVATAMRDPLFYRWHTVIDNLFLKYKATLGQYSNNQLSFEGVTVADVSVQISEGVATPNLLKTYWQRSVVDLSSGLDFGPDGNIFAQFTHLQHDPFNYIINATNSSDVQKRGTCRIFIGIRSNETGAAFKFNDQRILMIEMDKFNVYLNPGDNKIIRRSDQSSVTIPYERSFRNISSTAKAASGQSEEEFAFCGCGWPAHMLCPKGTETGALFDIFVMISDYMGDHVNVEFDENVGCNDSTSFCGLQDELYPDNRAMGFPFDRPYDVPTLSDFAKLTSNMTVGECTIRFTNDIMERRQKSN